MIGRTLSTWLAFLVAGIVSAQEPPSFPKDIRPLLEERCANCHGPKRQRSGLRLDRRDDALKGGDEHGHAIVPGKSDASPLYKMVIGKGPGRMPPTGPLLSAAEADLVRRWIDSGATWPDDAVATASPKSKDHWSFRPVVRPLLPDVKGKAWGRNPIDRFILAAMEKAGLEPSPEADRTALIRRVSFDLIGLPPTPEEIDAFVRDPDPRAYDKLVDRLLASPHHGERWGRHWLDVVRFAESHGFEMNQARPNAWRYRDYVIRSLNEDKPYDRFVREQIAGDVLGVPEATGFLVAGAWDQVKSPDPVLTAQQRADELHDMIGATSTVFLGLTVGCARCHDHKFDPIPQTDYYRLKACFEGVQHGDRPIESAPKSPDRRQEIEILRAKLDAIEPKARGDGAGPTLRSPPVSGRNVDRFDPVDARFVRFTILSTTSAEPCLDELEVFTAGPEPRNVALANAGAKASSPGSLAGYPIHKIEHVNDGVYGNSRSWISNEVGRGVVTIDFGRTHRIDRVVWSRDRDSPPKYFDRTAKTYRIETSMDGNEWALAASSDDRLPPRSKGDVKESAERAALVAELKRLEASMIDKSRPTLAYAGKFVQPGPTKRLHRGDATQPREEIVAGGLVSFGPTFTLPANAAESDRRKALAAWMTDPRHPLTARVMVNRLWHYHFGRGIVPTPSDLGINGGRPSHPELLDWLAAEFVEPTSGEPAWSLRHIHRLICLSATYRQSSRPNPAGLDRDSEAVLLWRYPPRRLEAESLRDSILAVTGKLNLRAGGPGFDLFEPNGNYVKVYTPRKAFGPEEFRRMVYQSRPRMQLDDTFGAFDCPDGGQVAPRRTSSTTPLQAFNLLNSPFMLQQADFLAERLRTDAGAESVAQVERAFRLTFGRTPVAEETAAAVMLIRDHGLTAFCRAMLCANEFLYVP